MNLAVFGLGHTGAVSAACFAELGHRVVGTDRDPSKVHQIRKGESPFYEPGLGDLIRRNVAAGRLLACSTGSEALRAADVVFLCVGTPSEPNGNVALEQVRRVVLEMGELLQARPSPVIVAVRSTVFPGACEELVAAVLGSRASVVSNPEFLREGCAVMDFMKPPLVVVGGADQAAINVVASLYAPLGIEVCQVSLRTAEMIKYACNAFHAIKVAFANEIGALSAGFGADGSEVMSALCRDEKLNLSAAYLKPGFAFGGSCLPKDLRALAYRARQLELKLPLIESALPSNQEHLERTIRIVMKLPARRLGVIGLAFKENTDDLRESPVIALLQKLIHAGREALVYDPNIRFESLSGSNRAFLSNAIPQAAGLIAGDLDRVLNWADYLIVAQGVAQPLRQRIRATSLPVLDLVRQSGSLEVPPGPTI